MTFNHHLHLFTIVLMLLMICPGNTEVKLNQIPTNVTAVVNRTVYFNCSTSKRPVEKFAVWRYYTQGGRGDRSYIYDGGIIKDRFDIEINASTGAFNLVLRQPQTTDAGRYECSDDDQEPGGVSFELTVLDWVCESNMDPEGLVGPNECDEAIALDELQLSCSAMYTGINFPEIEWRINGSSMTQLDTTMMSNGNKLICNVTMKASRQMEGSISICLNGTQHCSHVRNVSKVLYAFADTTKTEYHTGDEVTCDANTSSQLSCSYQWYKDYAKEIVSSQQTFKPSERGLYRCQAQCAIRNNSCTFTAAVISFSESGLSVILIRLILLLVLSFLFNIGFAIAKIIPCIRSKAKQNLKKKRNSRESQAQLQEVISSGSSQQKRVSSKKQRNGGAARRSGGSSKQTAETGTSSDKQQNGSTAEPLDVSSTQNGASSNKQQNGSGLNLICEEVTPSSVFFGFTVPLEPVGRGKPRLRSKVGRSKRL